MYFGVRIRKFIAYVSSLLFVLLYVTFLRGLIQSKKNPYCANKNTESLKLKVQIFRLTGKSFIGLEKAECMPVLCWHRTRRMKPHTGWLGSFRPKLL